MVPELVIRLPRNKQCLKEERLNEPSGIAATVSEKELELNFRDGY
jgi:hypothetical protein